LEREVEQVLSELEAVDAAVTALRAQLENAADDAERARTELEQLRGVAENWERAAAEGCRELAERQRRVEELLATLEEPPKGGSAEQLAIAAAPDEAERRAAREVRRLELGEERARVLEGQITRLEEQVGAQQVELHARLEERRRMEQQAEGFEVERAAQTTLLRETRASLKAAEANLRGREEAIAAGSKRRQDLERQSVHLRGEARGLRARIAAVTARDCSEQEEAATLPPPRCRGGPPSAAGSLAAAGPLPPSAASGEELQASPARAESLRLQHAVVGLWAALRRCEEAPPQQAQAACSSCRTEEEAPAVGRALAARSAAA